jgi:RHS repeat-associated protein
MIAAGARTLVYNQDNRLSRVIENGEVLGEYVYNAFGQRVKKTTAAGVTVFLYDFDGNLAAEYPGSPALAVEYLYFGRNCLARTDGEGNVYFYYNDGLGTPRMVVDADNTVVWAAEHAPFGKAEVNVNSTITNNLRFPGQYFDAETGLHYNWNRYYDPDTGRYLTPDPIGLAGGINLYAYVTNNPVNYFDPQGLQKCKPGSLLSKMI